MERYARLGLEAEPGSFQFYMSMASAAGSHGNSARQNAWFDLAIRRAISSDGKWEEFEEAVPGFQEQIESESEHGGSKRDHYTAMSRLLRIATLDEPPAVTAEMAPYRMISELLDTAADGMTRGLVDDLVRHRATTAPLLVGILREWAMQPPTLDYNAAVIATIALLGQMANPAHIPLFAELIGHGHVKNTDCAAWALLQIALSSPKEFTQGVTPLIPRLDSFEAAFFVELLGTIAKDTPVVPTVSAICESIVPSPDDESLSMLAAVAARVLGAAGAKPKARGLIERWSRCLTSEDGRLARDLIEEESPDWESPLESHAIYDIGIYDICCELIFDFTGDPSEPDDGDDDDPFLDDDDEEDFDETDFFDEDEEENRELAEWDQEHENAEAEFGAPLPWDSGRDMARIDRALADEIPNCINRKDLEDAFKRFLGNPPPEPDEFTMGALSEWLIHDYVPKGKTETVLERTIHHRAYKFDEEDLEHLRARIKARASLWEVLRVEEGTGMLLRDLLRGGEILVDDRAGSRHLVQWDCTFVRPVPWREG